MASKRDALWREQVNEAVKAVRQDASAQNDFERGMQSGASMVAVRLAEIQQRDARLKAEGIPRGAA